ncbi:hypothetical protein ACI01nite_04470 [Acetobacter cibinongensis]|uniref:Uncharacterized protein n=1 Tax=Acetobacter cibinongensis TaxID=146475 RepID=A0A0D6N6Z0_9PROT|nr:hypothetical protein Abci_018_131 [Acetobacter cibinongensis]GEL57845.1 hypothetical protein ACI01nite_04470 [Acetobacter cibinongensis]
MGKAGSMLVLKTEMFPCGAMSLSQTFSLSQNFLRAKNGKCGSRLSRIFYIERTIVQNYARNYFQMAAT